MHYLYKRKSRLLITIIIVALLVTGSFSSRLLASDVDTEIIAEEVESQTQSESEPVPEFASEPEVIQVPETESEIIPESIPTDVVVDPIIDPADSNTDDSTSQSTSSESTSNISEELATTTQEVEEIILVATSTPVVEEIVPVEATSTPEVEVAPAVKKIYSPILEGVFHSGSIPIVVVFNKPIRVSGHPRLNLSNGAMAELKVASGNQMYFLYRIGSNDASSLLDYSSSSAIDLNGATITDSIGAEASLILPEPGSSGSLSQTSNIIIRNENL